MSMMSWLCADKGQHLVAWLALLPLIVGVVVTFREVRYCSGGFAPFLLFFFYMNKVSRVFLYTLGGRRRGEGGGRREKSGILPHCRKELFFCVFLYRFVFPVFVVIVWKSHGKCKLFTCLAFGCVSVCVDKQRQTATTPYRYQLLVLNDKSRNCTTSSTLVRLSRL